MEILINLDLPAAVQQHELVEMMVAGANAKASRVAPCLAEPTTTAWTATSDYAVADRVKIAANEYLEVTVAGTSTAAAPVIPAGIGDTVTDGTVTWKRIAPTPDQLAEAKLVLLGAVKRWADAGSGALQSFQAGNYAETLDTRQRTGFNLWPSEIKALQDICSVGVENATGAFSIRPYASATTHLPWCSLNLGATYCSCGADIAGFPIYELAD